MRTRLIYLCLLMGLLFGVTYAQNGDTDHDNDHGAEHAQGETEHHDEDHHEEQGGDRANVVSVGDMKVYLDPMVSVEGKVALGLTFSQNVAYDLTVTTPSGETAGGATGEDEGTILKVDQLEPGSYTISGTLGDETLSAGVSVYEAMTDLGTQIITVLAPSPSVSTGGLTEAFIYGFADGENVHKPYMVSRRMLGMTHMNDDQILDAEHTHFDGYEVDFEPAANETPVSFPMVGTWQMSVALGGSLPETASFDVDVAQ